MHTDLPPLSGRASIQFVELRADSSRKPKSKSDVPSDPAKRLSSHLQNVRATAQGIAFSFFLERKAGIGKLEPTLTGGRFSAQMDNPGTFLLSTRTAKAAKKEFQSYLKFLEEEKRIEELKKYLTKLKDNFSAFYLALTRKNEEQKAIIRKQEIKRKQTNS